MNFGLSESLLEQIIDVLKDFPSIDKAYIFGSRAKGNFKDGSDIDLSIIGENISVDEIYKISQNLDELNSPYLFDLNHFNSTESIELKEHIIRIGKVIYSKN